MLHMDSFLTLTPELETVLQACLHKDMKFRIYADDLNISTYKKQEVKEDDEQSMLLKPTYTSVTAGIFGLVVASNAAITAPATPVATGIVFSVGATAGKTTAVSALKAFALPALGVTVGVLGIVGTGLYIGYRYHLANYAEIEAQRAVAAAKAMQEHQKILLNIQQITATIEKMKRPKEIAASDVPTRYREHECPIDYESLISNPQRQLFMLPCGHILHFDCYRQMVAAGSNNKCSVCRSPINNIPVVPVPPPTPQPYVPKPPPSFIAFAKNVVYEAASKTKDILRIGTIVASKIAGAILIALSAGTIALWVPTLVPTVLFIGVLTGNIYSSVMLVANVLGLSAASMAGGVILYAISVKLE